MAFDGRKNIVEISDDEKTIYFETWKPKKISGTKIGEGYWDIVNSPHHSR